MRICRLLTRGLPARAGREALCLAALVLAAAGGGCASFRSDPLPYARLALPYNRTRLGTTTALEVLNAVHDPAGRFPPEEADPVLLTQSDRALASSGRSADGRRTWLDLIVFDGPRMTAARKYFFCIDERATAEPDRPNRRFLLPRRGLLFDAAFAVDPEILTTPYATEEAQKIAILRRLAEQFQSDVTALVGSPRRPTQGNEQVTVCALMVNQLFQGLLAALAQSPGLAQNLATGQGVAFPHASLGEGRLRLLVENDVATLTIRVNFPLPPLRR